MKRTFVGRLCALAHCRLLAFEFTAPGHHVLITEGSGIASIADAVLAADEESCVALFAGNGVPTSVMFARAPQASY